MHFSRAKSDMAKNRGSGDSDRKGSGEGQRGELVDKVVKIKRCAAVVKGGRRFSFAAMVVVAQSR